jgi:hypothetical protein
VNNVPCLRAFVVGETLHLVFDEIDRPAFWGKEKPYQRGEAKWKLVPREGQRLLATRSAGKGKVENWLIVPLVLK